MERGEASGPPEDGDYGGGGIGDGEPWSGEFGTDVEDGPECGEFEDPEEIGIAFDAFAGVEDEAVTFDEVTCIAEADEGVVIEPLGDAGEPGQEREPGKEGEE